MPSPSEKLPFTLSPKALDVVESISQHYEKVYALPRIGCRILALLLLAPGPITMEDMERVLVVSHASVSTNVRLLTMMGYVERVNVPGERCLFFRFFPRSRVRVLQGRITNYRELKELIEDARHNLTLEGNSDQLLLEMEAWADLAIRMNSQFIVEWENYLRSQAEKKPEE